MANFERMNIAEYQLEPEDWGNENAPESDWSLANQYATFSHKEACEFIFYIGYGEESLGIYKQYGFSEAFLNRCREVQAAGFDYVSFYS